MNVLNNLFRSTLGKKFIMALTGGALFLFVVGHLAGNLQIFLGPEAINRYGHFLHSNMEIIWPARIGLLVCVVLHVWSAVKLTQENRNARPIGYLNDPEPKAASYASQTMLMSGLIVAAFIIYHLLHFTMKVPAVNLIQDIEFKDFKSYHDYPRSGSTPYGQRHDVYKMMIAGFHVPLVSGFYILAMYLLCLHLSHGVSAMFQSLGLKNKAWGPRLDCFARAAGWVIFAGYASIPLAVLLGLLR